MSTKQPLEVQIREVLSSGGTSSSASSATSLTTEHPVVVLPSSGTLNVSDSKQPTIIVLNRPPTVRSMNVSNYCNAAHNGFYRVQSFLAC